MHPVIHERKEAAGAPQMGNAEETNELIGKTGRGNTLDSAAKDVAAVGRSLRRSKDRLPGQGGTKAPPSSLATGEKVFIRSLF